MGTVNFSGAGSGIKWNLIIEAQIQARRRQIIEPLEEWKSTWETKISAFDELRSLLSDLQGAAEAMDTPSELSSYLAQSSDEDTIGAVVSGDATPGTYSLLVNQLADSEAEIHVGVDDDDTVVNNSGGSLDFAYTYAGDSVTVEVPDGATLDDLAALINNDGNNPGVTASVLNDGADTSTSHHLVLRGDDTGASYTITIDAGGTTLEGDWGDLTADASNGDGSVTVDDASSFQQYQAIIIDDDDSAAEYHIVSSVAGNTVNLQGTLGDNFTTAQNAYATPRGIGSGLASGPNAGDSSVSVDDASDLQVGKDVIIADGANSEQLTISAIDTSANTITFTTNLTNGYGADGFVTQLEGGRKFTFEDTDFTETETAQNAQMRVDGYPAGSWIERESNSVGDVIPGVTLTLKNDTGGSTVNVTVNQDAEGVKEKINAFVETHNAVKTYVNQNTDYNVDTEQAGVLLGNYAVELIESQLREAIITEAPGFEDGTDTYTLLGQIGIETLGRTDDETALGTLTVDEAALDAALSEDFEAVIALLSANFQGRSDSDYFSVYQSSETLTTPGSYDVKATFDGGGNLTGGQFKLTSESTYRDGTVSDPYIVGQSDNPEEGLWVKATWDGVSATQTAVVRVQQGIAGQIADLMDDVLDTQEGIIHNVDESYEEIVGQMDDRIEQEEDRLEQLRERLVEKYARLEQLLVELQGQQNWAQSIANSMGWTGQTT
ncbi:MAG: flagellar filament capping protein FliD [Candidatus Brocadiia bacterium]